MKENLNGFETDKHLFKGHTHYWVLHKLGHRFCSGCLAKKIGSKVTYE